MSYHTDCVWFYMFWAMAAVACVAVAALFGLTEDYEKLHGEKQSIKKRLFEMWQRYMMEKHSNDN